MQEWSYKSFLFILSLRRGQLGNGEMTCIDHPELVPDLQGLQIKNVVAGGWHCIGL